jgi:hypothetical protein
MLDPKDKFKFNFLVAYESIFPGVTGRHSEPVIRVQPNIRAADFPGVPKSIQPYIDSVLPAFDWSLKINNVLTIQPQRTLWEKVMAVHSRLSQHRDQGGGSLFDPKRFSRHYYDLAMLYESVFVRRTLSDLQLLADVREHDKIAYAEDKWRCIDEAKPGTIFIIPPKEMMPALEDDFEKMRGMMYGPPVDFSWVMDRIYLIHYRINVNLFLPALGKGKTVRPKTTTESKRGNKAQSEKFIEAARELGCTEDESTFDEIVKKVAKAPPPRKEEKAKANRRRN